MPNKEFLKGLILGIAAVLIPISIDWRGLAVCWAIVLVSIGMVIWPEQDETKILHESRSDRAIVILRRVFAFVIPLLGIAILYDPLMEARAKYENSGPSLLPGPEGADLSITRPEFEGVMQGQVQVRVHVRNYGDSMARHIRYRMLSAEKNFSGEVIHSDSNTPIPLPRDQTIAPLWMISQIGTDQPARYFVFIFSYEDDRGRASRGEFCYSWRGAKEGRTVTTLFQCNEDESLTVHEKIPKALFAFGL